MNNVASPENVDYDPVSAYGFVKAHWSLLAYIETCAVDPFGDSTRHLITGRVDFPRDDNGKSKLPPNTAPINYLRMRVCPQRHPLVAWNAYSEGGSWGASDGTWVKNPDSKQLEQLPYHDDVDVMDDLEQAGMIEIISLIQGFVVLTAEGLRVASQIRVWKAAGNNFASFPYDHNPLPPSPSVISELLLGSFA